MPNMQITRISFVRKAALSACLCLAGAALPGSAAVASTHTTADSQSAAAVSSYAIDASQAQPETFQGWGVSLCWWANMCGQWSEEKMDELVEWLVSPEGLNYRIFRYNIGGGDDPQNRHCTPHHMGKGKGLRAEMEGFKDSTADVYHWERDEAQRRILLKIRERRPDAVFEAFSNSCPWYMTQSGCVGGNANPATDNLKPEYYEEFAHYLVDVCRHYKDAYGLEFATLEPFNESLSDFWWQNGTQEGCHFDAASQVAVLRVLQPVLQASGLKTILSASDETSVGASLEAFQHYRQAGALGLVGQWNTHTYAATDEERQQLAQLTREAGLPLWMSETGQGGQGIAGNLQLAKRLIADVRLLQPRAWVDWQYVEENSDQWCTVRASFKGQTYHRVKNYYVRQQFSRFIREGYHLVPTACPDALAAVSDDGKTVVLVALNATDSAATHRADLSALGRVGKRNVSAWRTSQTEDLAPTADFTLSRRQLVAQLPPQSVTTFVLSR